MWRPVVDEGKVEERRVHTAERLDVIMGQLPPCGHLFPQDLTVIRGPISKNFNYFSDRNAESGYKRTEVHL